MECHAKVREQAVGRYREALRALRDESHKQRFGDIVALMQDWMGQLSPEMSDGELCNHAKRTITSLGGMGGIGDISRTETNRTYLESVDRLYRAGKAVLDLCGGS